MQVVLYNGHKTTVVVVMDSCVLCIRSTEKYAPLGIFECCAVDCLTESSESMTEYAIGGLCNLALGENSRFGNYYAASQCYICRCGLLLQMV